METWPSYMVRTQYEYIMFRLLSLIFVTELCLITEPISSLFFLMNMLAICQLNTGKEYVIDSFINTLINAINIIPLHLCDNELLIIACWSTRTLTHTQSRWLLTESGMHDLFHSSSKIEQQYVIQDDPL